MRFKPRSKMKKSVVVIGSLAFALALVGCDDENRPPVGGGPGSATSADVQSSGNGFCDPAGGSGALGSASYTSSSTAKIDTDGDPNGAGHDANWQPGTSGKVNGQNVNSAQYAYVVMSRDQMRASNVTLGDWALVTNNGTGKQAWARVEDVGPPSGSGEISEAAASAVGIQYQANFFTVGSPAVTVQAYGGTAYIQSDCSAFASN
jgi:hypothetical protein